MSRNCIFVFWRAKQLKCATISKFWQTPSLIFTMPSKSVAPCSSSSSGPGHFRLLVVFLVFLVNLLIPLQTRNMLFAMQPMLNHSAMGSTAGKVSLGRLPGCCLFLQICFNRFNSLMSLYKNLEVNVVSDDGKVTIEDADADQSCHYTSANATNDDSMAADGPFVLSDKQQALILAMTPLGQVGQGCQMNENALKGPIYISPWISCGVRFTVRPRSLQAS
jgi:hypothetical protein